MADLRSPQSTSSRTSGADSPNQNQNSNPPSRRSQGDPSDPPHSEFRSRSPNRTYSTYSPNGSRDLGYTESYHRPSLSRPERPLGSVRRSPVRSSVHSSLPIYNEEHMMDNRPPRKIKTSHEQRLQSSSIEYPRNYRPPYPDSRRSPNRYDSYRTPKHENDFERISPSSLKDPSRPINERPIREKSLYSSPRYVPPPGEVRASRSVRPDYSRSDSKRPSSWSKEIESLELRLDELAQENLGLRVAFIELSAKTWKLERTAEREMKTRESKEVEIPMPFKDGNLFVVDCFSVEDNAHRTISAALLEATAGSNIAVRQGMYLESLILKVPIRIFGVGIDVTVSSEKASVITALAENVFLENLRIKCDGDYNSVTKNKAYNCVTSKSKNLRLENCDLISSRGNCLCIDTITESGPKPTEVQSANGVPETEVEPEQPKVVDSLLTAFCVSTRFSRSALNGLFIRGSASILLDRCEIDSCNFSGIEARDNARITIQRSRIINSGKTGLLFCSEAHLTLESSDIMNSGMAGIELSSKAICIVNHSRIFFGSKGGVFVHDMSQAVLSDNQIFSNRMSNIDVRQGGKVTSKNNLLSDSSAAGVYVAQTGECTLSSDTIIRNWSNGVEVTRATLMCTSSIINKNGRFGICGNEESQMKIFTTDLRFNKKGSFEGQTDVFEENKVDEV
eukprot:GHVP01064657.1.p1 GENE.GHVP01064657.1~~GHVP01064657.1.p1  ORF type:complete len:678 (-),score=76.74 GHVP01064657.1:167-2200(-)